MGHCNYAKHRKFRVTNGLKKDPVVSQHRGVREGDLKALSSSFVDHTNSSSALQDYMPIRHMYRTPHEVCSVIAGLGLRHLIAWRRSEFKVLRTPPPVPAPAPFGGGCTPEEPAGLPRQRENLPDRCMCHSPSSVWSSEVPQNCSGI